MAGDRGMNIALLTRENMAVNAGFVAERMASIWNEEHNVTCLTGDPESIEREYFDRVIELDLSSRVSSFFSLRRYIKDSDVDCLVQVTRPDKYGSVVGLIGRLYDVKTVTRLSGDIFKLRKEKSSFIMHRTKDLYQKMMLWADRVITLSPYLHDELRRHGYKGRIDLLPQPLDREKFHPPRNKEKAKEDIGFDTDKIQVLFVGRLSEEKGFPTIINISAACKEIDFHVIGTGDMEKEAEEWSNQLENFFYHGKVPYSKIERYYQASDVFLLPSYFEGCPNVVLEANLCGVPSFTRATSGMGWISDDVFSIDGEIPRKIKNLAGKEPRRLPETLRNQEKRYKELMEEIGNED